MIRKGTVGGMTAGAPDGVGRNQVLIVNTGATTAATELVVIDRTACNAVVYLITFATHSEHFSGRLREQRSLNKNKQKLKIDGY